MICATCGTDECLRLCEVCQANYCEYDNSHDDCLGLPDDTDPPDATNPYAKPYDDALAGHLRNWEPKLR